MPGPPRLDVTDDIVFDGADAMIDGNHLDRVLDVRQWSDRAVRPPDQERDRGRGGGWRYPNAGTLALGHVQVVFSSSGLSGGGIRNLGVFDAIDSRVSMNNSGQAGGGIASGGRANSSLGLVRTTVASNTNTEEGGGIFATGTVRIDRSRITGNTGGPGSGMGLFNGGDAVVRSSVITGNGALDEICGGGVANTGTLEVRSTTVSDNQAEAGGGIYNQGDLTVVGGKVESNRARLGGAGIFNAIAAPGRGGSALVDGALIAGNVASESRPISSAAPADRSPAAAVSSTAPGWRSGCAVPRRPTTAMRPRGRPIARARSTTTAATPSATTGAVCSCRDGSAGEAREVGQRHHGGRGHVQRVDARHHGHASVYVGRRPHGPAEAGALGADHERQRAALGQLELVHAHRVDVRGERHDEPSG